MNWKLFISPVILFSATPLLTQADGFNYKFIEASYTEDKSDSFGGDTEVSSAAIKVSWVLEDALVLQAGRSKGEFDKIIGIDPDDLGLDIDLSEMFLFVGGSGAINENMSVLAGLNYSSAEVDSNIIDLSVDIWSFGADFRYKIIPMLELTFGAKYIYADYDELGTNENDFSYSAGLRFQPVDMISIGATYMTYNDADVDTLKADIRFQF